MCKKFHDSGAEQNTESRFSCGYCIGYIGYKPIRFQFQHF